jgi:glycosyltransferase involved in cell wall biosynthesis
MTDHTSRITIIIPVYNEITTIEEILLRVQAVELEKDIIIIDDGSTDGTREFLMALAECAKAVPANLRPPQSSAVLRADNIRVFFQDKNRGKGAALRRGFQEAKGAIIIIQDADLETDPADYHKLIAPIEAGTADVVYGSRFLGGHYHALFNWHYAGNRFLTMTSNLVTNLNLSDVCTCYKTFKRRVLESLNLHEEGFGIDQEITIKIAQARWRVCETPVSYYRRTSAEGKKIRWRDGIDALWCIVRYGLMARGTKKLSQEGCKANESG